MGLSRLWSSNDIYLFFGTGLVLGLIWNSFQWAIDQDKAPFPAKGFILSIILVTGLLGPQSIVDVTVISKRDNSYQDVSNVPLLPALSGWLITNSITYLAEGFAQAFSIVGVDKVWGAFSPIQHFVGLADINFGSICTPYRGAETSYNICKTMNTYLDECFTRSNLLNDGKSDPVELLFKVPPAELISKIQTSNLALQTTYYLDKTGVANKGIMSSCSNGYRMLKDEFNSDLFNNFVEESAKVQGVDLNEVQVFLDQQGAQGTLPNAESSLTLAKAMFLKSQFNNYFSNSKFGKQVAGGMFDTMNQRQFANAQKKEYWMENAEIMQSFFEALAVFLTPFIGLVLAISSKGLQAVGQYMMVWVFVQMWSVMIVLVNGFMGMAMTGRFTEGVLVGESVFSLTAIDSQFATANSYIAMGGMLYTFIPAICVFVMYRGVHAMQGMASKGMQDPTIKAERFAPDTGATINSGTGNFGNQSYMHMNNDSGSLYGDKTITTTAGDITAGGSAGAGASTGLSEIKKQSDAVSLDKKAAIQEMFKTDRQGGYDFSSGSSSSYTIGDKQAFIAAGTEAIVQATGMETAQAQRLMANGNVEVGADGKAGFNAAGGGMGLGVKAKIALGVDDQASQSSKESFSETLQQALSKSTEINAALSHIQMAGDSSKWGESASFSSNSTKAAQLAKTESALEEQGISLGQMNTSSGQVSNSTKVQMPILTQQMQGQSHQDYLQSRDPGLWDQIKNSEVNTANGVVSGEKYLEDQTLERMQGREGTSVTPLAEARAFALMDFVKQNDGLDVSRKGIDFDKEIKDNAINEGIFKVMGQSGVEGANQAAQIYEQRGQNLQNMQNTNFEIMSGYESKDKLGELPNSADIVRDNAPISTASEITDKANGIISDAGNKTANGQNKVDAAYVDGKPKFNEKGKQVADVPNIDSSKSDELDAKNMYLENIHKGVSNLLGSAEGAVGKVGDFFKSNSEESYQDMVSKLDPNIESERAVSLLQTPEVAKAFGAIDNLKSGEINNETMEKKLLHRGSGYQELVGFLNNDEVKNNFVKDGQATDLAKNTFSSDAIGKLEQLDKWYSEYKSNPNVTSINKAVEENQLQPSPIAAANTVLNAIGNTSFVNDLSGNSQLGSVEGDSKTVDLVRSLLTDQSSSQALEGTPGIYSSFNQANTPNGAQVYGSSADRNNARTEDIQRVAAAVMPLLTESQQEDLQLKLSEVYASKPSENAGFTHIEGSNTDNYMSAVKHGAQALDSDSSEKFDRQAAFKQLAVKNMDDAPNLRSGGTVEGAVSNIDNKEDFSAVVAMYENSKEFMSRDTQEQMELDLNKIASKMDLPLVYGSEKGAQEGTPSVTTPSNSPNIGRRN